MGTGNGNGNGDACEECTQRCLVIHHGRKDPSTIVTSFFKIMIGDRFSSVLFVPPQFVRTIANMVNQVTYLEDSKGQRWKVMISIVDGSLAIQQGWNEFASDHSLEIGDFLVFNYIAGSHFIVQMYGKSGCEKLKYSKKKNNSRNKSRVKCSSGKPPSDGRNSSDSKVPFEMTDKGSVNEQGSNSPIHSNCDVEMLERKTDAKDVAKVKMATKMATCDNSKRTSEPVKQAECFEVPFYMIDRDSLDNQGPSTSSLFDFEMLNGKSNVDGIVTKEPEVMIIEKPPHSDVKMVEPLTTLIDNSLEEQCHIIDDVPVGKDGKYYGGSIDVVDFEAHDDVLDFEMPERNYNAETAELVPLATDEFSCFNDISKQLPTTSTVDCCGIEMENLKISNGASQKPPSSEQLNVVGSEIDPVTFEREITHESSGRVPQSCSIKSRNSKNLVEAGKVPEVATTDSRPLLAGIDPVIFERESTPHDSSGRVWQSFSMKSGNSKNLVKAGNGPETAKSDSRPLLAGIDPVTFEREITPHESSGRVWQSFSMKSGNSKNLVNAGKAPEVAEKEKVKETHGKHPVIVKVEPEERFDFDLGYEATTLKAVKTEIIDFAPLAEPISVDFFCSAPAEAQPFLELPTELPTFSCKGRRLNTERRIILLRDSAMRKWPVLYHERSGFKVLANGWEALAKANNIQAGDICSLRLENISEGLLQLSVQSK